MMFVLRRVHGSGTGVRPRGKEPVPGVGEKTEIAQSCSSRDVGGVPTVSRRSWLRRVVREVVEQVPGQAEPVREEGLSLQCERSPACVNTESTVLLCSGKAVFEPEVMSADTLTSIVSCVRLAVFK